MNSGKLIEVALPLDVINKSSARGKSIGHGHPSTLHPWWARRPFQYELAFEGTSVNYNPRERLVQAEEPR